MIEGEGDGAGVEEKERLKVSRSLFMRARFSVICLILLMESGVRNFTGLCGDGWQRDFWELLL